MRGRRGRLSWIPVGVAGIGVASIVLAVASAGSTEAPAVKCRVEIDRGVLPAGDRQNAVVKVTLNAPAPPKDAQRPPVNLSIVLDRSGSMSGEKLEKAKDAAVEVLRRLGSRDIFSLVMYDHNVETVVPAQAAANSERTEGRIRQIRSGGNTALYGGVNQGAAELRKNPEDVYVPRMILLSDGLANVGPSTPDDLGRLGSALIKEEISVTTVGVGTDYNEDLMARLAEKSDGNTYFVEDSRDLARIFNAELGDVLSVVARKVKITIECPEGVEPVRLIGRDGRVDGQTVELSLNQLYGSQEKYVLLEVTVPATEDGARRDIVTAHVSYENAITEKDEDARRTVAGAFSSDAGKVQSSANTDVQRAYEVNLNALAQEDAIALADKGKTKEAVAALRRSAQNLAAAGERHKDKELEKAQQVEEQADSIESEGMSKVSRKSLRTWSYQDKNQQRAK